MSAGQVRNSEALLALHEFMTLRHRIGETEMMSDCCSCDWNNFHTCDYCRDLGELHVEHRRLLGLWGEIWAAELAITKGITEVSA